MRKSIAMGITALTIAAACTPLTTRAAVRTQVIKSGCIKLGAVIWNGNCMELPGLENIIIPNLPNCPVLPERPETPEAPVVPEIPETPETPVVPEMPEIPETPEVPETGEKSFAQQVVDLVNVERVKEGLAPLTIDTKLEQAALVRAKEIQTSFSHTRPNGSSFATAIREAGASYLTSGENIAWGQKTPEAVVTAWMNSPSHRANIMKSSFTKIGVGYLQNASGTPYWAQLFTN